MRSSVGPGIGQVGACEKSCRRQRWGQRKGVESKTWCVRTKSHVEPRLFFLPLLLLFYGKARMKLFSS